MHILISLLPAILIIALFVIILTKYSRIAKRTNLSLGLQERASHGEEQINAEDSEEGHTELTKEAVVECYQIRPWIRYWARILDLLIFQVVFTLPATYFLLDPATMNSLEYSPLFFPISIFSMFVFCFYQAGIHSLFGSTSGKALMKISLANADGTPISFRQLLKREFGVYTAGMAIGVPYLGVFSMLWSMKKLATTGKTFWDEEGSFVVRHRIIGLRRIIAYIVIIFAIIIGISVLRVLATNGY
ncbi:MAG: RDD family protein [Candidatus Cloacimonetes bacterium]|nr:RDD family protein [Candidatus Cloacimonadota bacterium]MDY0366982.1 RDD family protein [Candidatus Syntrophosphaera sp.]